MAATIIPLTIQLATVLAPEVVALYKAIVALRAKGVSPADAAALVQSLQASVQGLDADTLATLALIK